MSTPKTAEPPATRFLESALLFIIATHAFAMITMGTLLLPGMPGGLPLDISHRISYVAAHPWLWRIGWFGWQLTAVADLLLAVALVKTRWIPRLPAFLTLLVTLLTLIPDQTGQFAWSYHGPHLARQAMLTHSFSGYAQFESRSMLKIAGWGTIGYLAAALGWTGCFAAAGTWSPTLTRLSWATWSVFAVSTVLLFLEEVFAPGPVMAMIPSAGNAVGFVLLMLWLILVSEAVANHAQPNTALTHIQRWRILLGRIFSFAKSSDPAHGM